MVLCEGLNDPNKKQIVVDDCVKLIDNQVAAKTGISGLAIKAGYATVKGVKPGYITGAVGRLLPEAFAALDPMWSEGIQKGDPVAYFTQNSSRAADTLLSVTDAKIKNVNSPIVRGAYDQLRNSAKKNVEEAIPGLAEILYKYTKA